MDFVTLENIVKYASPEALQRFRDASCEFDQLYNWSDFAMRDFSARVGWEGERPLSFDGFAGVHLECGADRFELLLGEEVLGSVSLEGTEGLVKTGVFEGLSETGVRREAFRLLENPKNIREAREFTAGGRMYVEGFVVREPDRKRVVVPDRPEVPGFSAALERQAERIFGRGCELEVVPISDYVGALNDQLAIPKGKVKGVSARPYIPEGFRIGFNGRVFDDLTELANEQGDGYSFSRYMRDLDALGRFSNEANLALNRAAGLQDVSAAEQQYHFRSADYLMSLGATPGIVLTSGFGTGRTLFVEPVGNGLFSLTDSKLGPVSVMDMEETSKYLSDRLFSDDNISRARDDFRTAGFSLEPDRRVREQMKIEYRRDKAILPTV